MTLQNRVLPTGQIVAHPARGTLTGNRGILHRPDHTLGPARWTHPHWVTCTLTHPRGRHHGPMPDRAWTALFFLDDAVAIAAGHRPCGYCRRAAYDAWRAAWTAAHGPGDRMAMDRAMHRSRVTRDRAQVRFTAALADLPDATFVLWHGQAHVLRRDALLPYGPGGYGAPVARPDARVTVLTPQRSVAVLRAGVDPRLHPSAGL